MPIRTRSHGASVALAAMAAACTPYKAIELSSTPPDALVLIDGKEAGRTPLKTSLAFPDPAVSYAVRVSKEPDFESAELKIGYEPQEQTEYDVKLQPLFKEVKIDSSPQGATAILDGRRLGTTPLRHRFLFRSREEPQSVELSLGPDFRKTDLVIGLMPPDRTSYTAHLAPLFKDVEITTAPKGASVFIDGKDQGITPLKTRLDFKDTEREYEVTLRLRGYKDNATAIRFEPQGKTSYAVELDKQEAVVVEQIGFEARQTPSGAAMVMVRTKTLAYLDVIERSPQVRSVTRLTNNEFVNDPAGDFVMIGRPVLSPVDDSLVYELSQGKAQDESSYTSNLWRQEIGSTSRTRVTFGKWFDRDPVFTPDGRSIVFSSNRATAHTTLRKIKSRGSGGITSITNTRAVDFEPSISKDGLIVYTSLPPGSADDEPQIWTITSDGRLPTQLRVGGDPEFSPDGKRILFVRRDHMTENGKYQIWIMDADGGNETQLTDNTTYDNVDPTWSPDGQWILYTSSQGRTSTKQPNADIWIMRADGSSPTRLTTNGSVDKMPAFDREGKFIYFLSNRGGPWNIWRFEPVLPKAEGK